MTSNPERSDPLNTLSHKSFSLTATLIKEWFQYRCERKAAYFGFGHKPSISKSTQFKTPSSHVWKTFGIEKENDIIRHLKQELSSQGILEPTAEYLSNDESRAFLEKRQPGEPRYAHGLSLELKGRARRAFLARYDLPEQVDIRVGHPDLVCWNEQGELVLIDIKATYIPTPFHRAQVAFYAILMQYILPELNIDASTKVALSSKAEIWHLAEGKAYARAEFEMAGYIALVEDFLRRDLPRLLRHKIGHKEDTTQNRHHIYYKCEPCSYLPHCIKGVAPNLPAHELDISAVHGLTQRTKYALVDAGIDTVEALSGEEPNFGDAQGWALRTRGQAILERANALKANVLRRLEGQHTLRMCPEIHRPLYLIADYDPMRGRLCTLGFYDPCGPDSKLVVELASNDSGECQAIASVLGALRQSLDEIDEHNRRALPDQKWQTHIMVYEPSEAKALVEALYRHLSSENVRSGLVELVRIFPPEQILAEPEYRGYHHMPSCALKTVFSEVFAVPAHVSYDLARVTQSLKHMGESIQEVYDPTLEFSRPFSSQLPLEWAENIATDFSNAKEPVEADIRARLFAMHALAQWLLEKNADLPPNHRFLHLHKRPFSYHHSFDPFGGSDLEILHAQTLIRSRVEELQALHKLAWPVHMRQRSFQCYAHLELVGEVEQGERGARILTFKVPPASQDAEINPSDFSLILTDNDANKLLNPGRWSNFRAWLLSEDLAQNQIKVEVRADVFEGEEFATLWRRKPRLWHLDRVVFDVTTERLTSFLSHLTT